MLSGGINARITAVLAGPPVLDHDTRGGEPLDCGIVEAVLAQHLVRVLREFLFPALPKRRSGDSTALSRPA
jgi:hypothetical protein